MNNGGCIPNSYFNNGSATVYQYSSGVWSKLGNTVFGDSTFDYFGSTVSINSNGSIVAVGAHKTSEDGYVKMYELINGNWSQIGQKLEGINSDQFGWSVSLNNDGTKVAVGSLSGYVRTYQRVNNNWTQYGPDIIGGDNHDQFGRGVSFNSNGTKLGIASGYSMYTSIAQWNSGSIQVYDLIQEISCPKPLNITILPSVIGDTIILTACDSAEWNGNIYNSTGFYVDTLQTINGCDSIVTMDMTINYSIQTNDS